VAVAAALTPLITGPPTAGSVLAVFPGAASLCVDTAAGPRIVSLLSLSASGVPNGVRVPLRVADRPFAALRPGALATVGAREVLVGGQSYRMTRTWRTAVPSVRVCRQALAALAGRLADVAIGVPLQRVRVLGAALAAGDPRSAVRGLVGVGNGLTPGGDDIIAGTMVGLRASGRTVLLQQVRRALGADIAERTTAVSVDLLRLAAAGQAGTEALAVLGALHGARPGISGTSHLDVLDSAVDKLLSIGHTSGADLATGMLLGLGTADAERPLIPSPRPIPSAAVTG